MCTLLTMIKYQSLSRKVQGYMSQRKKQPTFQGNICLPDGQLCFYIYMNCYYKVGHCLFSSGYTGHWAGNSWVLQGFNGRTTIIIYRADTFLRTDLQLTMTLFPASYPITHRLIVYSDVEALFFTLSFQQFNKIRSVYWKRVLTVKCSASTRLEQLWLTF